MGTNTLSENWSYNSLPFPGPGLCSTNTNNYFFFYGLSSAFDYLTINTSWWTSNDYFYREVGNSFGGINRSNSQANIISSSSLNHNYRSIRCLKD